MAGPITIFVEITSVEGVARLKKVVNWAAIPPDGQEFTFMGDGGSWEVRLVPQTRWFSDGSIEVRCESLSIEDAEEATEFVESLRKDGFEED